MSRLTDDDKDAVTQIASELRVSLTRIQAELLALAAAVASPTVWTLPKVFMENKLFKEVPSVGKVPDLLLIGADSRGGYLGLPMLENGCVSCEVYLWRPSPFLLTKIANTLDHWDSRIQQRALVSEDKSRWHLGCLRVLRRAPALEHILARKVLPWLVARRGPNSEFDAYPGSYETDQYRVFVQGSTWRGVLVQIRGDGALVELSAEAPSHLLIPLAEFTAEQLSVSHRWRGTRIYSRSLLSFVAGKLFPVQYAAILLKQTSARIHWWFRTRISGTRANILALLTVIESYQVRETSPIPSGSILAGLYGPGWLSHPNASKHCELLLGTLKGLKDAGYLQEDAKCRYFLTIRGMEVLQGHRREFWWHVQALLMQAVIAVFIFGQLWVAWPKTSNLP